MVRRISNFKAKVYGHDIAVMEGIHFERIAEVDLVYAKGYCIGSFGRFLQKLGLVKVDVMICMKGWKYSDGTIIKAKGSHQVTLKNNRGVCGSD